MTAARGLGHRQVRVHSAQPDRLFTLLQRHGFTAQRVAVHELRVDSTAEEVGLLARFFCVPLHHLSEVEQSLEHAHIRHVCSDDSASATCPPRPAAP